MAGSRKEADAIRVLLGWSQEYLDEVHDAADAIIAARGPQPFWEPASSDSDFSDSGGNLLTPPGSPKGDGLDLSMKAWDRRKWSDLARGIELGDSGFHNYKTWRSHIISEHETKVLSTVISSQRSGVRKKKCLNATLRPERWAKIDLQMLHFR